MEVVTLEEGRALYYTTMGYPAYPTEILTTVVLVDGHNNDYAAYIGHGNYTWVSENGNKLLFDMAKHYFPWITQERYRQ